METQISEASAFSKLLANELRVIEALSSAQMELLQMTESLNNVSPQQ
jgi:hypothetical protein